MNSRNFQVWRAPRLTNRYLDLLGVSSHPPSLNALNEVVSAHLTRIPFENISKLLYKKRFGLNDIPPIEMYLNGVERYHFGGTCYSNNFHFYSLLVSLGYEAKLCAADMAAPGVHAVSIVTVEGHEYLVDTGYAAPFLAALPRDLGTDYVVALGRDRYVLKPQDANGYSRLELHRNGLLKHGYLAKPAHREIGDFSRVIANSFRPDATFLNSILLARFYPQHSVVIHNLSLIDSQGEHYEVRSLQNLDGVVVAIQENFDIPAGVIVEAVGDLKQMQDAWADPFLGGREH